MLVFAEVLLHGVALRLVRKRMQSCAIPPSANIELSFSLIGSKAFYSCQINLSLRGLGFGSRMCDAVSEIMVKQRFLLWPYGGKSNSKLV